MAISLKQIVYNLEDYGGSGGLISTDKNNHNELVYNNTAYLNDNTLDTESVAKDEEAYKENQIQIFDSNILENYSNVKKIGIQAPPGTKFTFKKKAGGDTDSANFNDYIMVGRTGIYEINDDIEIKYLKFIRPQKYEINEEASSQLQAQGLAIMKSARDTFFDTINKLSNESIQAPDKSAVGNDYWDRYNQAHQTYVENYNIGMGLYIKGKSGVYVKGPASDLYNVIIDFTYGETEV